MPSLRNEVLSMAHVLAISRWQGCSTLWNGQDFKQVIDARQSGAVAVLEVVGFVATAFRFR
jgi:hypothetical protein